MKKLCSVALFATLAVSGLAQQSGMNWSDIKKFKLSTKSQTSAQLATKADITYVDAGLSNKLDASAATAQAYGSVYIHDGTNTINLTTTNYTPIQMWSTNTSQSKAAPLNCVAMTNGVRVLVSGVYNVSYSLSMTGQNNSIVEAGLFIDEVHQDSTEFNRKISTGTDVGSASAGGQLYLTSNQVISVRRATDVAGAYIVVQGQLIVTKVGLTVIDAFDQIAQSLASGSSNEVPSVAAVNAGLFGYASQIVYSVVSPAGVTNTTTNSVSNSTVTLIDDDSAYARKTDWINVPMQSLIGVSGSWQTSAAGRYGQFGYWVAQPAAGNGVTLNQPTTGATQLVVAAVFGVRNLSADTVTNSLSLQTLGHSIGTNGVFDAALGSLVTSYQFTTPGNQTNTYTLIFTNAPLTTTRHNVFKICRRIDDFPIGTNDVDIISASYYFK